MKDGQLGNINFTNHYAKLAIKKSFTFYCTKKFQKSLNVYRQGLIEYCLESSLHLQRQNGSNQYYLLLNNTCSDFEYTTRNSSRLQRKKKNVVLSLNWRNAQTPLRNRLSFSIVQTIRG